MGEVSNPTIPGEVLIGADVVHNVDNVGGVNAEGLNKSPDVLVFLKKHMTIYES